MSTHEKSLAVIPRTVDEVRSLAAMFAKSNLIPEALRGKEADVFVSIMAGQELGLPPMAALRGVHVVKGKPVLAADTMVGLVLSSGLSEYFSCVEESPMSVTYATKRKGATHEQVCTWTMDDAHQAGLSGDNWKKYPRAMLKARCKAMLARDVYPDVLAGCYDEDEARAFADAPRRDPEAVDAEVVHAEPSNSAAPAAEPFDTDTAEKIRATKTREELRAFAPALNALPKGSRQRAEAMAVYHDQLGLFDEAAQVTQ